MSSPQNNNPVGKTTHFSPQDQEPKNDKQPMTTTTRHEPISQYRITIRHGNGTGETLYCDDRDEAIVLANELGGRAESFVYGIGWQPILKVVK